MNIVLIGSCLDSSNLAKELNNKMKNSVVFRIDLLKNLKNIIPFSNVSYDNNGSYLGDIERINFANLSNAEKDIAKAFQSSVKLIENLPSLSVASSYMKSTVPTIDRVTRNFDCLSLTLLRVVSGIQSLKQLENYLNSNSSAIVVYLEKPNIPLFEHNITKEQFLEIKEGKYENHLFLTAENLESLLKDEVFELILNPVVKEKKNSDNKVEVEEKRGIAERVVIQGAGPGVLHQMAQAHVVGTNPFTLTDMHNFMTELAAA